MITIIGAGPAGLATAYHLQRYNLPVRLLEQGVVGTSWHAHYDSLHLHTPKGISCLPGRPMPADYPLFPSKSQVAVYLDDYARHFQFAIETGVKVERAWWENGRWQLHTTQGICQTEHLIIATGIWHTPVTPVFAGQAHFRGQMVHAHAYKNPAPFVGQRVLVVGAGNSGTEIAAELGQAGISTSIAVREGVAFVPYPRSAEAMHLAAWFSRTMPQALTDGILRRLRPDFSHLGLRRHPSPPSQVYPVVGFELPEAVAAGKVTVYGGLEAFLPHGVRFNDGRYAPFDSVIMATGYRPTVDFVEPTLPLDVWGRPLGKNHPNLWTVGFYYPKTEGWLQAIGRFAQQVAREVWRVS